MQTEHTMFGYDLGDIPTRFARFEEGLEVIARLLRSNEPASYDGRFFRLHEAVLMGPRLAGRPPILVGAIGPRRGLPLVARFADVWSAQLLSPEEVRERSATLDDLLVAVGRRPNDVRRTFNAPIICGRTPTEWEDRLRGLRRGSWFADLSLDRLLDDLRGWPAIIGTPEEVVAQIRAYEAVGITEMTLQWFDLDDIEGLEILAAEVLPRLTPAA
jgi:alkanesulfonate monooxygenase SsuD/methylene tetrahydromethanopterin reductase-like flavin-dependent oxidoreductase (luciferase family)